MLLYNLCMITYDIQNGYLTGHKVLLIGKMFFRHYVFKLENIQILYSLNIPCPDFTL